jgi:acyl-CoA reductase-like NAD-dependent aldehyde dehydrogenase
MANRHPTNGKSNGHLTATKPARLQDDHGESRIPVLKTYKIFVGGKFPRTESGRFYQLKNNKSEPIANMCLCSRKDFRDAVVAARAAQGAWAKRNAYNRSQILYRIAEMLEGRRAQFIDELVQCGVATSVAVQEVDQSIDRTLYYAGWADKFQQIFSSVNPVQSSHFNFSVLEPTGVVAAIAPEETGLLGLVSVVMPAICGGNSIIALASQNKPLPAVTFAEVLATSDLPGGVVNILTGDRKELLEHMASHMDVNAIIYCGDDESHRKLAQTKAADNMKRFLAHHHNWSDDGAQTPYMILETQETKTTWHPIGV